MGDFISRIREKDVTKELKSNLNDMLQWLEKEGQDQLEKVSHNDLVKKSVSWIESNIKIKEKEATSLHEQSNKSLKSSDDKNQKRFSQILPLGKQVSEWEKKLEEEKKCKELVKQYKEKLTELKKKDENKENKYQQQLTTLEENFKKSKENLLEVRVDRIINSDNPNEITIYFDDNSDDYHLEDDSEDDNVIYVDKAEEKEQLKCLIGLHQQVLDSKKIYDSRNSKFDQLKNALNALDEKYWNTTDKNWAWEKYNNKTDNKVQKLYSDLKKKNSTFVRLQNINYYGNSNAELYMLYTHTLKNELPEYIKKVKEEMGARFIRFNEIFKKEKDESFGDFVAKKITDSSDFYFQPDKVWKEIENAKKEIQGKTLNIAPTIPLGLESDNVKKNNNVEKKEISEKYYSDKKIVYEKEGFSSVNKNWSKAEKLPTRLYNIQLGKIEETKGKMDIKNYAILSYVWGNSGNLSAKEIEQIEKKMKLDNLWENIGYKNSLNLSGYKSLKKTIEVCEKLQINYLWMDQLCTNQEDNEDKNQEVPKMRKYYSNSIMTLVSIDENLRENDSSLPSLPDTLKMIVRSEWFSRTWIFQEGWLSKQIIYMFDDELLDGRAIAQTWVLNQPTYTKYARYNSMEEAEEANKKIATPLGWVYYKDKKDKDGKGYDSEDKVNFSLGQVLKEVKNRARGNPIDGIYSILGLLPYGENVKVNYKPRICRGEDKCSKKFEINDYKFEGEEVNYKWGIEDKNCKHTEENKKWATYTKGDYNKALFDIMKAALDSGYGELFGWHGVGGNLLPLVDEKDGSTSSKGGLAVLCKCEKSKPHECATINDNIIETNCLSYTIISSPENSEIIGIEGGQGFLLEGGLHKGYVTIDNHEVSITGSKETLGGIEKNDILLVLDKNKWESESPFAILVEKQNNNTYKRKGLVGFSSKSEVEKLENMKKVSEKITIAIEQQFKTQIEVSSK